MLGADSGGAMTKLCCLLNGVFNCATCTKPLCKKHILGKRGHYGFDHKVQRCLQCHRAFVKPHRTGSTRMVSFKAWHNQVSRRQKKQGKVVTPDPQHHSSFWEF